MTTQAAHCYRLALRCAGLVLRRRQFNAGAVLLWVLVIVVTLAPARVGLSTWQSPPDPTASEPAVRTAAYSELDGRAPNPHGHEQNGAEMAVLAALDDCPNALPAALRLRVARIIHRESTEYGYDPLFITALVQVESGCSPTARGGEALGLVQLLPSTARGVARRAGLPWRGEQTLTEPSMSIRLGLRYLGELEDQLGDPYRAVAAYNLGPARVAHMSSRRASRTVYVRKILSRYEQLLEQYA